MMKRMKKKLARFLPYPTSYFLSQILKYKENKRDQNNAKGI